MSDVVEGAANLVGFGPHGGPLGSIKPIASAVRPIAEAFIPVVGPAISAADYAAQAGYNFSQGNTTAGALDLVGAGVGGAGALGYGPLAQGGTASATTAGGAGAAAPVGDVGAGTALTEAGQASPFIPTLSDVPTATGIPSGALPGSFLPYSPAAANVAAVSPEAGFGGAGTPGISAMETPSFATQVGQTLGLTSPTQGLHPIGQTGLGAGPTPEGATISAGGGGASPTATGGPSALSEALSGNFGAAGSKALDYLGNHPGTALNALGLGYSALKGPGTIPYSGQAKDIGAQSGAAATTLMNPLLTGQIPPAFKSSIDQALQSAKANAISRAAAAGMPTDPTQNSALALELQGIEQQGPIIGAQIATQMFGQGANMLSLEQNVYDQLANRFIQQNHDYTDALVGFSTALAGGGVQPRQVA